MATLEKVEIGTTLKTSNKWALPVQFKLPL